MEAQKEALLRIISTLSNKNEELQNFLLTLQSTGEGLEDEASRASCDLEAELLRLSSALSQRGAELSDIISEEQRRRQAALSQQVCEGEAALTSCEELLLFANQTLGITNEEEFLKAAKQIKERVTMAPAFRLSLRPAANQNMAMFTCDFSSQEAGLRALHFLPVPQAPEILASSLVVRDNSVSVAWQPTGDDIIERYEVQHRKTNTHTHTERDACWEIIPDVTETAVTITGLRFDTDFLVVRVRARNKMAAGEFSEPVAIETKAFCFSFDGQSSHAELKVEADCVQWQPQVRGQPGANAKEASVKAPASTNTNTKEASVKAPANTNPNAKEASVKAPASTNTKEASVKAPANTNTKEAGNKGQLQPSTSTKGHDPRLRAKEGRSSRSATPSPNKMTANRATRFAGESYTVLGDRPLPPGPVYWELKLLSDWKSVSVGVAYSQSLGRFDQLGKSSTSWCLSAGQWLSSSLSAKHNNKVKTLEFTAAPERIGIYCHYEQGELLFVDVDRLRLLHGFKTRFTNPLLPAFSIWCGGIAIETGLQVPSFIDAFLSSNQSTASNPASPE